MVAGYTIDKLDRRWILRKNGEPVMWDIGDSPRTFTRKRDAAEMIPKLEAGDRWTALLFEQDASGVYVWTEDEEKQINEYAALLKENAERWTFFGKEKCRDGARRQHQKDAEDLKRTDWVDPKRLHAEKRRIRAARVEAFKRAGLELEEGSRDGKA